MRRAQEIKYHSIQLEKRCYECGDLVHAGYSLFCSEDCAKDFYQKYWGNIGATIKKIQKMRLKEYRTRANEGII